MRVLSKFLKVIGKVILGIIIIFVLGVLILTCTHQIMKKVEKSKYTEPGIMVNVNGEKMHVYSEGYGEKTIVLLSGYGTQSPAIDYKPLIRELSKNYKTVVIENFGYGWSGLTDRERSVENIIEENRRALEEAGFSPPYILMPHSMSGIYANYYANKYPEEVEAIVGIDTTIPEHFKYIDDQVAKIDRSASLNAPTGVFRLITKINPEAFEPSFEGEEYSEEDLKVIRLMSAWQSMNKNLIDEFNMRIDEFDIINRGGDGEYEYGFSEDIPVLMFLSKETIDNNKELGEGWLEQHNKAMEDVKEKKTIILNGPHNIHWKCSKEMGEAVREFLNGLNK